MEAYAVWRKLYILLVLFTICPDVTSHRQGPRLTALGCYRDSPFGQRIFSTLLQRVQVRAWWHPDVSVIVRTCRDAAVARGYRIFSIQNLRECRWGPTAERDYARYGFGWYCYRGVGWYDSGSVYRVDTSAPVKGQWSNWSPWTQCSRCTFGIRSRTRSCTNPPPSNGGAHCGGPRSQSQLCGRRSCQTRVDGSWSVWSSFSACTVSCNRGTQIRSRTCSNPFPQRGGRGCPGSNVERRTCNTHQCPNVLHGGWSLWQPWGSCARSCGGGSQRRFRTCNNPAPRNGGNNCQGANVQSRRCNTNACAGCVEGRSATDRCGRRCTCSAGRLVNCARVRREFTTMTTADRARYIRAVRLASTDPRYKPDYDQLITLHKTIFQDGIHERDQFLPWHRWFVLRYENILQRIDCQITVPFWDWSVVSQNPWRTGPSDLWFDGESGLGGNGEQPAPRCVIDGPFRRGAWNVVPSAGNGCLRREFNLTDNPPDSLAVQALQSLPPSIFDDFELTLRINLHDNVHCLIGGHMCSFDSATSPEFALHHSFIDKIWMDWQRRSRAHLNAHFPQVANNMPGTAGLHPRDVIDNSRLPGGVRVEYQASQGPQSRSVLQSLSGFGHSPRRRFSVLSEKAIKLFNVSKAEVEKAKRMGRILLPLARRPADQ